MRRSVSFLSLFFLPTCALAQTVNYANPQYSLPGLDYKTEAPSINQMFENVYVETKSLRSQIVPAAAATGGTNSVLSGSTFTVSAGAVSNFCEGGVLVASGSFNSSTWGSPFKATINFVGAFQSSRTYVVSGVIVTTQTGGSQGWNHLSMNFNAGTTAAWTGVNENKSGSSGAAAQSIAGASFDFPLVSAGFVNDNTWYQSQPATFKARIVALSSTSYSVVGQDNYIAGGVDTVCNSGALCDAFLVSGRITLAAPLNRIDLGGNKKAPQTSAPDYLFPMNGHWHICAEGWADNP